MQVKDDHKLKIFNNFENSLITLFMKRLVKIRNLVIMIWLVFGFYSVSEAQCPLTISQVKACKGSTLKLSIPATTSYFKITWHFGDGDSSNQQKNDVTHMYDTFGVFTAKVITYNSNGSIKCSDSLRVTIWDNPRAGIKLPDSSIQCFRNNLFCFSDISKPGKFNGAPIVKRFWDFGDGDSSLQVSPCHQYASNGVYTIYVQIKDTNGCTDTAMKKTSIVVLPDLKPRFTTSFKISCPKTTVNFKNTTDTLGKCITKFYWDFGDGTWDSSQTNWTGFNHVYTKDGSFNPKLYVQSCYDCRDSFIMGSGARNIYYNFDVRRNPGDSAVCWDGNSICFSQTPRKLAYYWLWTFNDQGAPPPDKTNDKDWTACHSFSAPGKYDITLKIWEPNCIRDTTMCIFTPLKGPMAMIKTPPPPAFPLNQCLRGKPISIFDFAWIKSTCLFPVDANGNKITTIRYVTVQNVPKFKSGTRKYYCNAPVISQDTVFQPSLCPGYPPTVTKINYRLDPAAVKTEDVYDSVIKSGVQVWDKTKPIPPNIGKQYYYDNTGFPCNDQTMNENEIYKYNCQGPNLVRYTNNSLKFRLRYDIDNDPTEYFYSNTNPPPAGAPPALKEYDRCANKAYPWASDSMQYFWNFGDSYGKNCTSTTKKPNLACRFSTEVQPWHLFSKTGCFSSQLTVTDTVTKCTSQASVQIIMEPPQASWDMSIIDTLKKTTYYTTVPDTISKSPLVIHFKKVSFHIDRLDWQIQGMFRSWGKIGLVVNGTDCVGQFYPQTLDMGSTRPTCGRQSWWVLFDSSQDCTSKCSDMVLIDLDSNGVPDTFRSKVTNCNWIDQSTWAMMGSKYFYPKGGCKTVGFIIKTGDCVDTFFYHNYKYIYDNSNNFNIMDPDSFDAVRGIYTAHLNYTALQHLRLCAPFQAILTVPDTTLEGIVKFKWTIAKYFGAPWTPAVYMQDSCKKVKDVAIELCRRDSFEIDLLTGDTTYLGCIWYPGFGRGCYLNVIGSTPIDSFKKLGYFVHKKVNILSLTDTVFVNDTTTGNSMWVPGKYNISPEVENIKGCKNPGNADVFVGHYTDFSASDQIICYEGGGDTVTFKGYVRYFQPKLLPTDPDLNQTPFWEDPIGYRLGVPPIAPNVPESIEWDCNGDGIFETKSILGSDSVTFVYTTPGDYTVTMRTIDSNNCKQELVRKAYIKVIGVVADFDTLGGVSVCAPQTVKFVDKSYGLNIWRYLYNAAGSKIDSIKVDSVISWKWDFGDNMGTRSFSAVRNPVHTYINNGSYNVRLIVKMSNGCVDTVFKPNFIVIEGPKPHIRIIGDTSGCQTFILTVKDSSADVTNWEFVKGDGNSSSFKNRTTDSLFLLNYPNDGTYWMYLIATDSVWNNAIGTWTQCTSVYGEPSDTNDEHFKIQVFKKSFSAFTGDTLICSGYNGAFNETSDPAFDSVYWDFGDQNNPGNTVFVPKGQAVTHNYVLPKNKYDSNYTVLMSAQGAKCPDGDKTRIIRVKTTKADFDTVNVTLPKYTFRNNSKVFHMGATNYKWTITGIEGQALDEHYYVEYNNDTNNYREHDFVNMKGTFRVCLITWIESMGCYDTACKTVVNTFETKLIMPNIFTPNGDPINNVFQPVEVMGVEKWDLTIYNRWGEKVFKTDVYTDNWDGTIKNKGNRDAPEGTYFWVLNYMLRGDTKMKTYSGSVTLKR